MLPPSYVEALRAIGLAQGLHRVGVTSADPFAGTLDDLLDRRARGLHADMQFTYRNPARSTDPARSLDGARSLVVAARAYPPPTGAGSDRARPGSGLAGDADQPGARVASYAVGDHYRALRDGLDAIAARLVADGHRARVLADDNALVDRAAAHRAGLGWFGKNANLLVEGAGSWVVLGSVLTDAELPAATQAVPDGCGTCTRCIDGCPTGAIVAPGVVDARRCLAWSLQARGTFPADQRVALGDRIYGCDECQEVCPPSRRATRVGHLDPTPVAPPSTGAVLAVLDLLALDDEALLGEVGRWYIADRDPDLVRRNALVVLGNTAGLPLAPSVEQVLVRYLGHGHPLLRAHAVWAAKRLGRSDLLPAVGLEDDEDVRAELARPVVARQGSRVTATPAAGAPLR